ncbi:AMP-binding protein [Novosphingobium sp. G106]|uniref:class I adenylate-forming enzyme family protein n=1 Tax=Novosphingobium sp. G106 TaxID=2849500 RepID=UPI001C2D1609|nr:AMP-binding protein [Novosphingobium sp. G106]MBV1686185.1 AMP-binding protein [Novosphingobium sp. G106]
MSQDLAGFAGESANARPVNLRDPLAERMLGPGGSHTLETVDVAGFPQQVFKGAARNLAGLYRQGMVFGDRLMVVQDDLQLTYADAFARAAALADALRHRFGVTHGTRVAVVMGNRAEWIVSVLAITAVGGVAALVNSRGAAEEMLRAIATASCELAILDAERAAIVAAERPDPVWPRIVVGAAAASLRPGKDGDFGELSEPRPEIAFEPNDLGPEDGGIILFTSGTTGFPKGALLSHGALAHSVSIACFMGLVQDARYEEETGEVLPPERRSMATPAVILGPMFHLSGIMPIFRAISLGTTIHIMSKWNVDIAFDTIENVGMSRLSFVPAMLWDMLRSPRATSETLGKVAYMANGAASLNPTLLAEIRARMPNCLLSNTYGQTETTAWTCSISGQAYLDNPASCGWAAPTIRVSVRRDDGSEAEIGEAGELWVSSAGLMSEYVGDAKSTAETLQEGWLASGDVAIVDANGIFTIVDRKKNMVISGGENIYCAEVERVLSDHADVRDCIAYGQPDERLGERLAATLVVPSGSVVSEDDIKAHCRKHLAIYKVPRSVVLTSDPLPRTASGKVDRGKFLKQLHGK